MAETAESVEHAEKVDILLVDDQPEGLLTLEAVLECLGQNLVKARSGREALREVLARDFAVILLDVQMPGMDGYETATLIRERAASQHTPIIFLTGSYKADVQMTRGYSVGAVDYLFKPLDAGILRSKVAAFIELAKQSAIIRKQAAELGRREAEARRLAETRAELLAELQRKNLELAAVNVELEAFSRSVSHDLRGPLRGIDGFSLMLLEDYGEQLDDKGKKYLRTLRESAQRMAELIDGLLVLARVTRGALRRERVDLTRLARECTARLVEREAGAARSVSFEIEEGLWAEGDSRLLGDVLENLLGNAWKFTSKRQDARIEVGRLQEERGGAFFVRDNGAGFDMSSAEKLFGAFERLHPASEFEGHGIGLATVQRIVRRHGGRVWAEGEVGVGATFYFTLGEGGRAGA